MADARRTQSSPVGILALQGCIDPHIAQFARLGISCVKVRTPAELAQVERLVLPGGESTTMLKLIDLHDLWQPLTAFVAQHPVWGICAGAILLAAHVEHPTQRSLGAIAVTAERNAYGSQRESFSCPIFVSPLNREISVQFIRAPRLRADSKEVEILATHDGDAVLLRRKNAMVSSFHAELGEDPSLHEYFMRF